MLFYGKRANAFDVVGMVMCDDDSLDERKRQSEVADMAFEGTNADAEVDDDGCPARFEVIAVAARAAAYGKEFHCRYAVVEVRRNLSAEYCKTGWGRGPVCRYQKGSPTAKCSAKSRLKSGCTMT